MIPALAIAVFAQLLPTAPTPAIVLAPHKTPPNMMPPKPPGQMESSSSRFEDEISELLEAGDEQMLAGEFAAAAELFREARIAP